MRYSALKRMRKSTKIGLATSAIYTAASFALPVFANTVEKPEVIQPISLEGITTIEQVEDLYKQKLISYSEDKVIAYDELTNLHKLLVKEKDLREEADAEKNKADIEALESLKAKKAELLKKQSELNNAKSYHQEDTQRIIKDVEEKVFTYYPGLLGKEPFKVIYSGIEEVKPRIAKDLVNIISEADELLSRLYHDDSLKPLLKEQTYTISDVLVLYKALTKEREVEFKDKSIEKEKELIIKQIEEIDNELVWIKPYLDDNLIWLDNKIKLFEDYFNKKKEGDEFIERYGNINRYWTRALLLDDVVHMKRPEGVEKDGWFVSKSVKKLDDKEERKNLEEYFVYLGNHYKLNELLDVKIEALKNPAKTGFPNWITLPFGIMFPVVRSLLLAKYVRREIDEGDIAQWILGGFFGPFIIDAIHPYIFPIRMFITPFVEEPLRWVTGGRVLK